MLGQTEQARVRLAVAKPRCGWFDTVALTNGVTPADLGVPVEGA